MASLWLADLLDLLENDGSDAALGWLTARGAAGHGPVRLVEGTLDVADALAYAEGLLAMGLDALATDVLVEAVSVAVQPETGLSAAAEF